MNRRNMIGDHHGPMAGRATLLARAMDEIFGTHRVAEAGEDLRAVDDVNAGDGGHDSGQVQHG